MSNPRISLARRRFNERHRESLVKQIGERIVLPCVVCFGAGVLLALHLIPAPPADLACEDAAHVAAHQTVAMGVQ